MEFEHVGLHCQMAGCNQKDFLPFKCTQCSRNLCLQHREYKDHGCAPPDAVSVECPICKGSIRMDRSADPNLMWDVHFASSCSQKQTVPKSASADTCSACRIKLGPSNTFNCNKCGSRVCMSHRMPEDHGCSSARRSRMVQGRGGRDGGLFSGTATSTQTQISKPKTNSPSKPNKHVDPENTLIGTAQRRAEKLAQGGSGSPASSELSCPVCAATLWPSLELLTKHIEEAHMNQSASNSNSNSGGNPPGVGSEICPQCSSQFTDINALIHHVETVHRAPAESAHACITH